MTTKTTVHSKWETMNEKETATNGPMTKLSVVFDYLVYQKIDHWIQKATGEVSGLGKVIIDAGVFRVVDAILLKQENTSASTEIDAAAVAKAMYELRDAPGVLNFWWHSHVNMGVFWSGTDIDTIRDIGRHGFLVSTVFNKRREYLSSIYFQPRDGFPEIFIDNLETRSQSNISDEQRALWDKEYDEKCQPKTYYTKYEYGGDNYPLLPSPADEAEPSKVDTDPVWFELEMLCEQMETQETEAQARSIYRVISNKIDDSNYDTERKSVLRDLYLKRFNDTVEILDCWEISSTRRGYQ